MSGKVRMLLHFGQGCGTESAVAQYSMSSALKTWPHSVHLKCVFPLFIVFNFQFSVISYRLSVFSYRLSVVSFHLSSIS